MENMNRKIEKIRGMVNKDPLSVETLREILDLNETYIKSCLDDLDDPDDSLQLFIRANESLRNRLKKMT